VREIPDCEALLLSNHGALTVGADVMQAYYRMEVLEMYARVRLVTKILGEPRPLDDAQVAELVRVREAQGWGRSKTAAAGVDPAAADSALVDTVARIVIEVLKARGMNA
jgi:ribulose-5-phosphate 4-epimerase/fuculose-1-phosphate aldolase